METRRYTIIDVYFNVDEQILADKKHKELIKQGYELNAEDMGTPYDYCNQYIKYFSIKKKATYEEHGCVYVLKGGIFRCKICNKSMGNWLANEIKKDH